MKHGTKEHGSMVGGKSAATPHVKTKGGGETVKKGVPDLPVGGHSEVKKSHHCHPGK